MIVDSVYCPLTNHNKNPPERRYGMATGAKNIIPPCGLRVWRIVREQVRALTHLLVRTILRVGANPPCALGFGPRCVRGMSVSPRLRLRLRLRRVCGWRRSLYLSSSARLFVLVNSLLICVRTKNTSKKCTIIFWAGSATIRLNKVGRAVLVDSYRSEIAASLDGNLHSVSLFTVRSNNGRKSTNGTFAAKSIFLWKLVRITFCSDGSRRRSPIRLSASSNTINNLIELRSEYDLNCPIVSYVSTVNGG